MKLRQILIPFAAGLTLLLIGCSDQPAAPVKKVEEKPEPVKGLTALARMFQVARTWDPRVQVLKITSTHLKEVPEVRGKAAAWEGIFVSPTQSQMRTLTFSVVEQLPSLHKGVFSVGDEAFSGTKGTNRPFLIEGAKIDTDKALETALAEPKTIEYEKKNPDKLITFILELTTRYPDPTWRVVWGESLSTSNYSVYVNATTGKFLEVMH
jgi:hypothetical protein